jgi:hypothetical protein
MKTSASEEAVRDPKSKEGRGGRTNSFEEVGSAVASSGWNRRWR